MDAQIREKEVELEMLINEVEVLRREILEGVEMGEKGELSKKERVEIEKKGKENEMKMLDLDIKVDETTNEIKKLKLGRDDMNENLILVKEYIDKYYEDLEMSETEKRKRESNENGGGAKKSKTVSIFSNLTEQFRTEPNIITYLFSKPLMFYF